MKKDLIVIGAGNPDIIKLIEDINEDKKIFNLLGFLDKNEALYGEKINGYEIIGGDELIKSEFKNCAVVNNVFSDSKCRYEISQRYSNQYGITDYPNLIHPTINLRFVKLGFGNILYQNISIGANVEIGNFNLIFYGSTIGHESKIGDDNLIAANVMIGARAKINNRNYFGNSSTINLGISIADDIYVGVGSVVVHSIKLPKKVFGNPAKELRF